jgi:hypothetical protein
MRRPAAFAGAIWPLLARQRSSNSEQAPKKLIDFFDKSLLQHFDFERFLIVRTIPFERKALWDAPTFPLLKKRPSAHFLSKTNAHPAKVGRETASSRADAHRPPRIRVAGLSSGENKTKDSEAPSVL